MTRELIAATVMVWLIGAIVGWCAGWAARGEQNRVWHRTVVNQLAQARARLAEIGDQLDDARPAQCAAQRMSPPASAVVHVTVATAVPSWAAHHPVLLNTAQVLDAMPVLPAEEVHS
jgi:hypothetical protein